MNNMTDFNFLEDLPSDELEGTKLAANFSVRVLQCFNERRCFFMSRGGTIY